MGVSVYCIVSRAAAASRSCFSSAGWFLLAFFKANFVTFYSRTQLVEFVSKRYPNHDCYSICRFIRGRLTFFYIGVVKKTNKKLKVCMACVGLELYGGFDLS